jgi:hypothetical protein
VIAGQDPAAGSSGAAHGGAPAGESRRVSEAMRFDWMVFVRSPFPVRPGGARC